MEIKITKDEDGYWFAEIEKINAIGSGNTIQEAFCRLGESIEVLIESYLYEDDDNLTEGAIKLKERLKEFLKE